MGLFEKLKSLFGNRFISDEARDAWFERLETYFVENADKIRWPRR